MAERVVIEITGPVAEVVLNRPEKRNAIDMAMFDAIAEAGEQLKSAKGLRAVILRGAGEAFCAGLDTAEFMRMLADADRVKAEMGVPVMGGANRFQRPVTVWSELPVPVIAVLHGVTYGGGAQIALGADFRIADPTTRFSIMEARWGLVPDMGITQSLPKLIRADIAKELIMTARVLDTAEAHEIGLLTKVSAEPLSEARAMAQRFAQMSPDVLRAAKRLVDEAWHAERDTGLALEADLQAGLIASPNQIEAVTAGFEKRAPLFKD